LRWREAAARIVIRRRWRVWLGGRPCPDRGRAAGLTKFVVRPSWSPGDPDQFTADFVREMVPLQT
jgi:hypothetical protein